MFFYFMFVLGAVVLSLLVIKFVVIFSDWIKELINKISR